MKENTQGISIKNSYFRKFCDCFVTITEYTKNNLYGYSAVTDRDMWDVLMGAGCFRMDTRRQYAEKGMNVNMKKLLKKVISFSLSAVLALSAFGGVVSAQGNNRTSATLADGVNIIQKGAVDTEYDVGEGKTVMIAGTADTPIVFDNCVFNLSGKTVKISGNQNGISYKNGEVVTKLWIGQNVIFNDCTFLAENGGKSTSAGFDAAIYFFSGDIQLNKCKLEGKAWEGQFMGLYGSQGSVTFKDSSISTVGNIGGWSYAMYGGSVLKLNHSSLTATGMQPSSGNINAFYSGDNKTGYDAIFVENGSTVDFHDNKAGGFAINNVNIYVSDSTVNVSDNWGNACNSGYWIVDNSTITMNGNRGGHALSCIGFEMTNTILDIHHNGYAGVYLQSRDSSFTGGKISLDCNGERLLSYSAGDVWLNGYTLTLNGCESVWLGGVGRKGQVVNNNCASFVAYDLNELKGIVKSNTSDVLTGVELDGQDMHTLFLNPGLYEQGVLYARGNLENVGDSNNDGDLFAEFSKESIVAKDTAVIGSLTTAQLSHHVYDWANGKVTDPASETTYGVMQYSCVDCAKYAGTYGEEHPYSGYCQEVANVYAPLVGVAFDANAGEETVTNMPEAQTAVSYNGAPSEPADSPLRDGYTFTGWYTDANCTQKYDFASGLTANWTVLYAGWQEEKEEIPDESTPLNPPEEQIPDESTPLNPPEEQIPDESTPLDSPATGESSNNPVWIVIGMLLAGSCAAAVVLCKRKKTEESR